MFRHFRNRYRRIFRFDDGQRIRRQDPLLVALLLKNHPTYSPQHDLSRAQAGDEDSMIRVADVCCDVFNVAPWQEKGQKGLTIAERYNLMLSFDFYLSALKKNIKRLPIWRRSMAATCSRASDPTTAGLLPFGSHDIGA